jgi:CheY-like chemotaxis protein
LVLNLRHLRVLVVDDNKPIRDLLSSIFESFGVGKTVTAHSGEHGFQVFQQEYPDIAFVDWDMEPGTGLDLTKKIRTDPLSVNRTVPIIMLTGYSAVFRVAQARDTGVTEFLTKPFTAADIAKRLSHVVNNPRDFIEYPKYSGPDRRRRKLPYAGDERRRSAGGDFIIDLGGKPEAGE